MARPKNKEELIEKSEETFQKLLGNISIISKEDINHPGVNHEWSAKDILAHLHAWHSLMEGWYKVGMKGKHPKIPSDEYTWKETPLLNKAIYQQYKDATYIKVLKDLNGSHKRMMKIIKNHTEKELFTKKIYNWTGSTSLGAYLISATSSHYEWANEMIRKSFLKEKYDLKK